MFQMLNAMTQKERIQIKHILSSEDDAIRSVTTDSPCLVTICLGVLSIVLGVCLKWAILPPVVDSMVMSQLR